MIDNPSRKVLPKEISDKFDNEFDRLINSGTGDCLSFNYDVIELRRFLKEVENKYLNEG